MISDKLFKTIQWGKKQSFQQMVTGKLDTHTHKRMKLDCYITPYTKIHSKWLDLYVRPKILKFLEENRAS